jgi:hypothetical protein
LGALTYGVTQCVLLFWWAGFYPGTLSYDSVMYVWQVSTSNWSTQHSVLYNGLVWLSLQATGGLGVLTLAQSVAMAAGLAHAVTGLRRLDVPGRWLAVAAVAATCLPAVGTFTVYVSKDVPYVVTQVWLLGTVARIVASRPSPPRPLWLALLAEFVLMGLFRHNGVLVIGLTGAFLAVMLAGLRWRVAACTVVGLAAGPVANLAIYPALGVRPAGTELVLGPAYADIAVAYSHRPTAFTDGDERLMASVAPLEYWSSTANCYNADSTVTYGKPSFNVAAAREREGELLNLWLRLLRRKPDEIVSARLCRGAIAWNPLPGPARGRTVKVPIAGVEQYFDFPPSRIERSPFADAIRAAPRIDAAHSAGVVLRRLSDARSLEWLAWRGATWCYVAYLAVILFARRRGDVGALALAAVVAANQVNVLVNNPGQLMRYMAGPIILGILLLPLAFAGARARSVSR